MMRQSDYEYMAALCAKYHVPPDFMHDLLEHYRNDTKFNEDKFWDIVFGIIDLHKNPTIH